MKIFSPILLIFSVFSVLSFSGKWVDSLRSQVLSTTSAISFSSPQKTPVSLEHELALENQILKEKLSALYEWLLFDNRIDEQTQVIKHLKEKKEAADTLYWREFFQRRSEEEKKLLEMQMQSVMGKVIYREPASWSSSIWLNVGTKDNDALGRLIIAKNSPVLCGPYLVGMVEYVDYYKCRIRLITDHGLVPSVRAIRGGKQDEELFNLASALTQRVQGREEIEEKVKQGLLESLKELKKLFFPKKELFLAKGELHGTSDPLWSCKKPLLKGKGFNYHFKDREYEEKILAQESFLEQGDLLVTTGLDGVFPAGLPVAVVEKVLGSEDGLTFDLEAYPCCPNMNDLSYLYIIPPLEMSFPS